MSLTNIQTAVNEIKYLIEHSIRTGGVTAKNNLIRSQGPINLLHDAAKASFIANGVNPQYIKPAYGTHVGELKLAGYFKQKNQDVCILPNNVEAEAEWLPFDSYLEDTVDDYGLNYTERILAVNVRSQLSSIAKNFDTLYERTFAEALNLHHRCPQMVLGEFYMIPVYSYDDQLAKQKKVGFMPNNRIQEHIQKYIRSFGAIGSRSVTSGEEFKYERVCLLIVDFDRSIPKIYNTDEELKQDGLLPENSSVSIADLSFPNFTKSLLDTYEQRFGSGKFI